MNLLRLRVAIHQKGHHFSQIKSPPGGEKFNAASFEVLASVDGVDCAVLADQVKSLDWKVLEARKKAAVTTEVMLHVRAKIKSLLMIH